MVTPEELPPEEAPPDEDEAADPEPPVLDEPDPATRLEPEPPLLELDPTVEPPLLGSAEEDMRNDEPPVELPEEPPVEEDEVVARLEEPTALEAPTLLLAARDEEGVPDEDEAAPDDELAGVPLLLEDVVSSPLVLVQAALARVNAHNRRDVLECGRMVMDNPGLQGSAQCAKRGARAARRWMSDVWGQRPRPRRWATQCNACLPNTRPRTQPPRPCSTTCHAPFLNTYARESPWAPAKTSSCGNTHNTPTTTPNRAPSHAGLLPLLVRA